jgi:hypothetical protein
MNKRNTYYIVSLLVLIVGIAIIGIHVHNYRQTEAYQDAVSNMVGTLGSDQSLYIPGRIAAPQGYNVLGKSKFADEDGSVVIQPDDASKLIKLQGNTNISGNLQVTGRLCSGTNQTNCLDVSSTENQIKNMRGFLTTELLKVKEGDPIKCASENNGAIYRYTGGERRWYPSPNIASKHDKNWFQFRTVDCSIIPAGPPMQ